MTELFFTDLAGVLKKLNEIQSDTILFITDGIVWEKHRKSFNFEEIFPDKKVMLWKTPDGELTKSFDEYQACIEFFLEKGVHRNSYIVALGGGALSDFAGFVASTLLRGIRWSIVPTTLLSMVDASVGGKTAINSKVGKNLIGTFYPPESVFMSTHFLDTLPDDELLSGKGEIIKYGFLDKSIYNAIVNRSQMNDLVKICAEYKLNLTVDDLHEKGLRKILNLGHTLGHALERLYRLPHGEAVVWGMVVFFHIFDLKDMLVELQKLKSSLNWDQVNPPWRHKTFPTDDIFDYITRDKKVGSRDSIDVVLVNKPGDPFIQNIKLSDLQEKIRSFENELKTLSL